MTDLEERAIHLQSLLEQTPHREQLVLQPRIDRVIAALRSQGLAVPPRLRQLNERLRADAFDDMFDNMPV
ncbi:hypothetical protein [Roseobacter sp.]|uniref:hypothetical protein n=1 Tax=Roseobacter sp. TaxID=1907202 RepID=UPI0025F70EC0|nr:hypothetical protein [Roseobacter sp.]